MVNNSEFLYGKLYIEKKSLQEWMILSVLILPFIFATLTEIFRIPSFITFSLDLLLAVLCGIVFSKRYVYLKRTVKPIMTLVFAFLIYTLVIYCFNFQSPFYYLWGMRNNFRFYVAFFVFVIYLTEKTANKLLGLLDVVFWINFAVSLFQFFFLDIRRDHLGGLFGTVGGTNGYTLIFFCIIISRSLLMAFSGQEKTYICAFKIIASLLIAAMAEMKFYYIAFILILILAAFLTSFSKRKLILIIVSILGIAIGTALLSFWFDEFKNFLSLEAIIESATKENYSSNKDVNRWSAIFTLSRDYVTDMLHRLFGLGLGNCDTSSLDIFNSAFYQENHSLHYTWFASAMWFLETGFVGMVFYFSFFIICFLVALRGKRSAENKLFFQLTMIMSILCCIIAFYNSALRIEAGYMAYFVLALAFIGTKESKETNLP